MQNSSQKLKRQPRWDKLETVLLMDTFINIEKGKLTRQNGITKLSECLRNYAINNGKKIDEKYRNISGIGMKIENIRFVYSNGTSGLAAYSKLEKEVVCLYKENPKTYNELLNEAKQIFNYLI